MPPDDVLKTLWNERDALRQNVADGRIERLRRNIFRNDANLT